MKRKTNIPILDTMKGNDVARRIASIFYSVLAVAPARRMVVNHGLLQRVLMMKNANVKENAVTSELVAPTVIISGWSSTAVVGVGTVVRCTGGQRVPSKKIRFSRAFCVCKTTHRPDNGRDGY